MNFFNKSSMNVHNTGPDPSASTSSGNPFSAHGLWKGSAILRTETQEIQSFLQQMEQFLTSFPTDFMRVKLTESFGPGGKITLTLEPLRCYDGSVLSGYLSRRLRNRKLRNGDPSQGSR